MHWAFWAGCLVLSFGIERSTARFNAILYGNARSFLRAFLPALLRASLLCAGQALDLPIALLYALIFWANGASYAASARKSWTQFWLWNCITFLIFAIAHLSALSALSIAMKRTIHSVYSDEVLGNAALLAALAASALVYAASFHRSDEREMGRFLADAPRLKQLCAFLAVLVVYSFFDAALCAFDLPYGLVPYLMLASSLLLAQQVYLAVRNTYRVALAAQSEADYHDLLREGERHKRLEEELLARAYMDGLTGLYSRRYALEALDRLAVAQAPFSLAFMDIDGLKRVNDAWGHVEGDRFLVRAAHAIKQCLEEGDFAARYGGDEFLLVSPGADREALNAKLDRAAAALRAQADLPYRSSFSYGSAQSRPGESVGALLQRADQAMYRQKRRLAEGGVEA